MSQTREMAIHKTSLGDTFTLLSSDKWIYIHDFMYSLTVKNGRRIFKLFRSKVRYSALVSQTRLKSSPRLKG